jgi:hypothetical protein
MRKKSDPLPLPPKVPLEYAQLDRAIVLLGCCSRGELRLSKQAELIALVGRYPETAGVAALWKRALKTVRDDEIFTPAE